MNYLAHILLSNEEPLIKIGNFMADAVKGSNYKNYPIDIQMGIVLHRAIDTYTDAHSTFRQSKKRLFNTHSHYSGVIVDIFYDHFLAKNWNLYTAKPLNQYVNSFYVSLQEHFSILPETTQHMIPYMIADNWLYNYRTLEAIDAVLNGLYKRTKKRSNMHIAIIDLKKHYCTFEKEFLTFFTDLQVFANQKLESIKYNQKS